MAHFFGGALGVLGVVLLARLGIEWRRYALGVHLISRRQMILRAVSAAVLLVLLVLVGLGMYVGFRTAEFAATYWSICLVLAFTAIVLAIWDLRVVRRTAGLRRAESFRRLSAYIRTLERAREDQVPPQ